MNTLRTGDKAPQFTLLDKDDSPVSLAQFNDKKVLVYFYPKAMTPGCNVQAQGLRDSIEALNNLNVVVLGISPDATKRLVKFSDKYELNFSLLSDEDHQVADDFPTILQRSRHHRVGHHHREQRLHDKSCDDPYDRNHPLRLFQKHVPRRCC